MKSLKISFVILLISIYQSLFAQNITIEGVIRHANTYAEIPMVNVYLKDSNVGTISNYKGNFLLWISKPDKNLKIIFEHISFYPLEMPLSETLDKKVFYLKPRILPLPEVNVEGKKEKLQIEKDIPQAYSVIEAKNFEMRGYIDAGDLLKTEQSIQVDEQLSGKKTVAIRGGNADDVIVAYNGIKLNNIYDNVFDFSLLNLDGIQQIEVIRGSNTTLFGAEAVSGVINIIPKTDKDYNLRFQQKFGTYNAGDWNIHSMHSFADKINVSFNSKQGGSKRAYPGNTEYLKNNNSFLNTSVTYKLSDKNDLREKNLNLMYLRSKLEYENDHYNEIYNDVNQIFAFRFIGDISIIKNINMLSSYQRLDNTQSSETDVSSLEKEFLNQSYNLNLDKTFYIDIFELLVAYQFENSKLDYKDERNIMRENKFGIESAIFNRQKHGVASIIKLHVPTESNFWKTTDLNLSYRVDNAQNSYENILFRGDRDLAEQYILPDVSDKNWKQSMYKLSSYLIGSNKFFNINTFMNYGTNYKLPTMFQQISSPANYSNSAQQLELLPETNKSIEIGVDLTKINHNDFINGYQLTTNYFRNSYNNKIRTYHLPYTPMAYYDNIKFAEISGLEAKLALFLLNNKIKMEMGSSKYTISEKAAFPFKSEIKHVANISLDHVGYSLQLHWFKESEQVGWFKSYENDFWEFTLPGHSNIDVHLSKFFTLKFFKIFMNFSARNLLDDDTKIEGLAIRDRRFYFTIGAQL